MDQTEVESFYRAAFAGLLFLLTPAYQGDGVPSIHSTVGKLAIPIISSAQRVRLPIAWTSNTFRGNAA